MINYQRVCGSQSFQKEFEVLPSGVIKHGVLVNGPFLLVIFQPCLMTPEGKELEGLHQWNKVANSRTKEQNRGIYPLVICYIAMEIGHL